MINYAGNKALNAVNLTSLASDYADVQRTNSQYKGPAELNSNYSTKVTRELENIKQELSKLRLNMDYALQVKMKAE